MSSNIFKQRGNALEEEFFRRVDEQLTEKLRAKWQHECDVATLKQETRIEKDSVIEELLGAGIRPCTIQVMMLVPSIHVAWANGFIEKNEREAVLQAAESAGITGDSTSGEMLASWLDDKPPSELFPAWQEYTKAMQGVLEPASYRHLHTHTVKAARKIAESAGGWLGVAAVSTAEEAAIRQIDEAFTKSPD